MQEIFTISPISSLQNTNRHQSPSASPSISHDEQSDHLKKQPTSFLFEKQEELSSLTASTSDSSSTSSTDESTPSDDIRCSKTDKIKQECAPDMPNSALKSFYMPPTATSYTTSSKHFLSSYNSASYFNISNISSNYNQAMVQPASTSAVVAALHHCENNLTQHQKGFSWHSTPPSSKNSSPTTLTNLSSESPEYYPNTENNQFGSQHGGLAHKNQYFSIINTSPSCNVASNSEITGDGHFSKQAESIQAASLTSSSLKNETQPMNIFHLSQMISPSSVSNIDFNQANASHRMTELPSYLPINDNAVSTTTSSVSLSSFPVNANANNPVFLSNAVYSERVQAIANSQPSTGAFTKCEKKFKADGVSQLTESNLQKCLNVMPLSDSKQYNQQPASLTQSSLSVFPASPSSSPSSLSSLQKSMSRSQSPQKYTECFKSEVAKSEVNTGVVGSMPKAIYQNTVHVSSQNGAVGSNMANSANTSVTLSTISSSASEKRYNSQNSSQLAQNTGPFEWLKPVKNQPNGKTRTKDKYRVVYSESQRMELESEFCLHKYITIKRKAEVSQRLNLSERQIKIWFQNRRAKERKSQRKHKLENNVTSTTRDSASFGDMNYGNGSEDDDDDDDNEENENDNEESDNDFSEDNENEKQHSNASYDEIASSKRSKKRPSKQIGLDKFDSKYEKSATNTPASGPIETTTDAYASQTQPPNNNAISFYSAPSENSSAVTSQHIYQPQFLNQAPAHSDTSLAIPNGSNPSLNTFLNTPSQFTPYSNANPASTFNQYSTMFSNQSIEDAQQSYVQSNFSNSNSGIYQSTSLLSNSCAPYGSYHHFPTNQEVYPNNYQSYQVPYMNDYNIQKLHNQQIAFNNNSNSISQQYRQSTNTNPSPMFVTNVISQYQSFENN